MAAEFREQREAARVKAEREQARAAKRPDAMSNLPAFLQEELGFTEEEAGLAVRNGVFSLFPEDAPPDHRQRMWEAAQSRKERLAAEQQAQAQYKQYQYTLEMAARSATEETFPDSVAFYDGDHARYARALEKKHWQLFNQAEQTGAVVDLSGPAVQRALESDLADRLTKTEQKRASRKKPAEPAKTTDTSQSVASNLHTSTSTVTTPPRAGKKTKAEADAEVMAILQRQFSA